MNNNMTELTNINSPIEQRSNSRGDPNAILHFGEPLKGPSQNLFDGFSSANSVAQGKPTRRAGGTLRRFDAVQRNLRRKPAEGVLGSPLNTRQQSLLDSLPEYDSRVVVPKNSVNMADLAALTAKTGVEYAMFTKGNERLVVRGDCNTVNVDVAEAKELNAQGYRWSGHTHVSIEMHDLIASPEDDLVLRQFRQNTSVIYGANGKHLTFSKSR
jgi:hypothetical protein